MKLVAILMLVPALAFADKTWVDNKLKINWDCKTDPVVSIMGNDGTYSFVAACDKLVVKGNNNTIHAETVDRAQLDGNGNKLTADHTINDLIVNGTHNTASSPNSNVKTGK